MKGDSRWGVRGGSEGFWTERVERVVGDPIIVRGNRLGAESRTEGVESHHHLGSVVSIDGHCWRWELRTLGRGGGWRLMKEVEKWLYAVEG